MGDLNQPQITSHTPFFKMKYTILFTAFIFALASSEANNYSNLSDDVFCQYVGTWVDRAESLTPGFKWNIAQMCQDGKYQLEEPGLFCDILNSFYGNGESWCASYSSCQEPFEGRVGVCMGKKYKQLAEYVKCPGKTKPDLRTGFCL